MRTELPVETVTRAQAPTCVDAEPFALRILDDSMEPELEQGCIVIVDPSAHARSGSMVLAQSQGEASAYEIRLLELDDEQALLKPLNPAYQSLCPGAQGERPHDVLARVVKGVVVQRAGARRSYHKRYDTG